MTGRIKLLTAAFAGLVAVCGAYAFFVNNMIIEKQERIAGAWSQSESARQRRHDLVPRIAAIAQASTRHEAALSAGIAQLRKDWASAAKNVGSPEHEKTLEASLFRFLTVAEKTPALAANENFSALLATLEGSQNRIAIEQARYLEALADYKSYMRRFPQSLLGAGGEVTERSYPAKPSGDIAYVNLTGLKYIDPIAAFELERGRAHIGAEFAMALIERLPAGVSLQNYAAGLFKAWDIGRGNGGKGVLYVLVRDPGLLKIETGYALESLFPDTFLASYQEIIRDYYTNGMLGDAISHLVVEMINRVKDPAYDMSVYEGSRAGGAFLSGGGGISGTGYAVSRIEKNFLRTRGEKLLLEKYDAAVTPEAAVDTFLASLEAGISSPQLGLLGEGSRYMAMEYRRSPVYQRNRYKGYQRALPYRILRDGAFAVARFREDLARPVFLQQRGDGKWQVEETKMWAFTDSNDFEHYRVVLFSSPSPWDFAFDAKQEETFTSGADRPAQMPPDADIRALLEKLESEVRQKTAAPDAYFRLADIFFFENYWIRDALTAVEKGLALDPRNETYLRRAIYFGSKMPDYTHTARHFDTLLEIHPNSYELTRRYLWFVKNLIKDSAKQVMLETRLAQLRARGRE